MLAFYTDTWTVILIIIRELPIRIYTEWELFSLVLLILSKAIPLRDQERDETTTLHIIACSVIIPFITPFEVTCVYCK
jgi:hypothetical protein